MNTQKLKIKDIITVTLLALINIVIFIASSVLYMAPITILFMPVLYGLAEGIVFFTIGVRVRKPGAILLYCLVRSVLSGYLPYILCYLAAGLLGELILKKTGYGKTKGLSVSYVIIQVFAAFGGTIYPYVITAQAFFANAEERVESGDLNIHVIEAADMISSWGSLVLIVVIIVASIIGTLIGKRVVRKHLLQEV